MQPAGIGSIQSAIEDKLLNYCAVVLCAEELREDWHDQQAQIIAHSTRVFFGLALAGGVNGHGGISGQSTINSGQ